MTPFLLRRGSNGCVRRPRSVTYGGGRFSTFIHIRTGLFCDSSQMNTMYDTIIYSYATKVNFLS